MLSKPLDHLDTPENVSLANHVSLGTAMYWIFLRDEFREGRIGGELDRRGLMPTVHNA